jgi:hypothetical protein
MKQLMIVDAVKYSFFFFKNNVWALMRMVLVFMAVSIALGLVVAGSSIVLLQSLSNNIWLTVVLESPLLAAVGYLFFGMWSVSFITYLLALERTGCASVKGELKKSLSLRVVKIIAFDLVAVLAATTIVLMLASVAGLSWWFGGMQLALWLKVELALAATILLVGLFYLYIRLLFTKIIIADADADIFAAFAASWAATRAWFWRLVAMLLVVGLIGGCLSILAGYVANLLGLLTGGSVAAKLVGNVLQVLAALFSMVFGPLVMLYYYNKLAVAKSLTVGK